MGFNSASVPRWALSTRGKYRRLINSRRTCGNCIGEKNVVAGALIDTGYIKLADVQAPVTSGPEKRAIPSPRPRQYPPPGCQKIRGPQTRPSVSSYAL